MQANYDDTEPMWPVKDADPEPDLTEDWYRQRRRQRFGNNKFKPTKASKVNRKKIAAKSRRINRRSK